MLKFIRSQCSMVRMGERFSCQISYIQHNITSCEEGSTAVFCLEDNGEKKMAKNK